RRILASPRHLHDPAATRFDHVPTRAIDDEATGTAATVDRDPGTRGSSAHDRVGRAAIQARHLACDSITPLTAPSPPPAGRAAPRPRWPRGSRGDLSPTIPRHRGVMADHIEA